MRTKILGLLAVALLAGPIAAQTVPFTVTTALFLPGDGYGIDRIESAGNLLDVRFSTSAFIANSFTLSAVNQSFTFNFGTIDLEEPGASSGIVSNETDDLDISAKLPLTAPTGLIRILTASGVATIGSVGDPQVDYAIDWSPVTVLFGNGGSFRISLTDMSFSDTGTQMQTATVTLLSVSDDQAVPPSVPEPGTLALLGLGLAGLGLSRRRKAH